MARWHLVRHGDTDWTAEHRIQGQTDVSLNDKGRAQAALTGWRLARERFAAVYVSDLSRAWETARIILDAQPANERPAPSPTPALREVLDGVFEGKTWEEVIRIDPYVEDREITQSLDFASEGGESYRQLLRRVGEFGEALKRDHAGDDVLVVAHSVSLSALVVGLLGLPDDAIWLFHRMQAAGISVVVSESPEYPPRLAVWNDAGHLV